MKPSRPSAALVLGLLSGTLAAVTVLPTIIPLTWRVVETEDAAALRQVQVAAGALAGTATRGADVAGLAGRLGMGGVAAYDPDGLILTDGVLPDDPTLIGPCTAGRQEASRFVQQGNDRWAVACARSGDVVGLAIQHPSQVSATVVSYLVLGLAAMVGISTALGVLQMLSPLSDVTRALQRVGAGERGVRASATGLAELDDLVNRLNAAAQAVEDREDTILARIEVVQHLARVVAHEIRNPLQSLELLTGLIASENDAAEREDLARNIQAEIRTLENVVQRLLRDAPGQAALRPTRSQTQIRELVRQVITFRQLEAQRKGASLEAGELTDRVMNIDRAIVRRALENLVANALQVVPSPGGRVRLIAREQNQGVALIVEDNGPGVDEALGNTIYQANVTTREGGHGLGLALVQGVMQAHDGYVTHERSELGGARFVCWLPNDQKDDGRADPGGG